jgi:hypothetical protein
MESSWAADRIRVAISPLAGVSQAGMVGRGWKHLFAMRRRFIGLCGGRDMLWFSSCPVS